jgi:pimeloyl-ACP methyl ester carboxylesterase
MLKILYTIIVCYAAVLAFLYFYQRNMLYFPTPLTAEQISNHDPYTSLGVQSKDGLILRSWQADGDKDKKTFVFFHGNAGNAANRIPMMKILMQAGHPIVLAEYRGYGNNSGSPSEEALISDAHLLIDKLKLGGLVEEDMIFMGRSLGTGVATQLASLYNCAALILVSPYSSLTDVASGHYPYFPVTFLMKDKFNSAEIIKNVTAPILMFHG